MASKIFANNFTNTKISQQVEKMAKVLVINAGGTLSMKKVGSSFKNDPGYLDTIMLLLRENDAVDRQLALDAAQNALREAHARVVPIGASDQTRISYEKIDAIRTATQSIQRCHQRNATPFELADSEIDVIELNPVLDSSEMNPGDWSRIASTIDEKYDLYRGFVVLHGTDTMGFTSSALSFLLTTSKPVILTGSQNPIYPEEGAHVDQEALHNLVWSCKFAKEHIPEVVVFFYRKLMRGVRTTKISADNEEHAAFDCPKTMPVVEFREHSKVLHRFDNNSHLANMRALRREHKPSIEIDSGNYVVLVRLFPGIRGSAIDTAAHGIVIQAFGAGNGPISNASSEFRRAIKRAIASGKVVCFVTECMHGSVSDDYASSLGDQNEFPGIVACSNMTAEAAFAKLCVGLSLFAGKKHKVNKVRTYMRENLHGESDE